MDKFAAQRETLESSVLRGPAATSPADRQRAATDPDALGGARARYCGQVAQDANGVTDEHIAALRAEGLGDREIFEYTAAAAVGRASAQIGAALAALRALGPAVPR
jgi:alkylhydroperoxidase family enzyme